MGGGGALETLHLPAAYCVTYAEVFQQGDPTSGAYVCHLTLIDPAGWTIQAGGPPVAFAAPAPGEHGTPQAMVALANAATTAAPALRRLVAPTDVPAHLAAPHPNPSPDHAQVHVTAAEWQAIIKDRWDGSRKAKGKKFLRPYRRTEFHVAGDPFTYRTDHTGKMVAVYDAQKSYNITGSKNGLLGIPLTLNGQPTYAGTAHMFPVTGTQLNVVSIDMAGNRASDFRAANQAANLTDLLVTQGRDLDQAPEGYTWHHRDDFRATPPPHPPYGRCTMELVETQAHEDTFVHKGACDQCNKQHKKPGRKKLYT
jgi:hypothetical protein